MNHSQFDIMNDSSEIVHYDNPNVPLYIRKKLLSNYPDYRAVCHWHNDFEIIMILTGEMNYYVNGQTVLLKRGEAIIVNSREMHYGYSNHRKECEFICILFHPSLLFSNKYLFENGIITQFVSSGISHLKLCPNQHAPILKSIHKIYEKKKVQDPFYEYDVIGLLYFFMADILRSCQDNALSELSTPTDDTVVLRKMVSFIHDNYKNTISLNDIAASANICKSKCCSVFQEQIHQTPFEFLNTYRLKQSAELLKMTNLSITSIATYCGFNHSSYYTRQFGKFYHCTPSEYRKC